MIYADLHTHTAYSDGTHSIEEVLILAKERGIKAIAITDHDTVFHYDQVKKICGDYGLEAIRGVEISCYDFDVYKKVHIVGLWLNDNPYNVKQLCAETLRCRNIYHHKLIEELNQKGLTITYEEAKFFAPYNIVFKMHLFQAIISKYPEYNDIKKYRELFAGKTSYKIDLEMGYIDIKDGIRAIQQDNGIAILAHPCEYDNYAEIEKYVDFGLQGIEISHPSMKEKDYLRTHDYAYKYNLVKSGGSDFHNIKLTSIGEYGLTKEEFEEIKKASKKEINR